MITGRFTPDEATLREMVVAANERAERLAVRIAAAEGDYGREPQEVCPCGHYAASHTLDGCLRCQPTTTAATASVPNGDGTETVIWCSRPGHPGPYAHTHPYISALCSSGENHAGCTVVGQLMNAPDFCDCECHHA